MKSFELSKRDKYKYQDTHHWLKKCVVINTFKMLCVPLAPGSNPCSDEPQEFIISVDVNISFSFFFFTLLFKVMQGEYFLKQIPEQGIKSCETQG